MKAWGVIMRYHFNAKQKEPESATKLKNEQTYAKEELLLREQRKAMKGHCYESYCHIGKGGDIWNPEALAFLNYKGAKATAGIISPELRERAKLYRINGLFEVLPNNVYQIRGYDSANLTLIRTTESRNNQYGWIVINCLRSKECTYEALKMADAYFRQRQEEKKGEEYCLQGNIKAIILTEEEEACYGGTKAVQYYNQGCKSKSEEAAVQLKEDITIFAAENYGKNCMKNEVSGVNVNARRRSMAYGRLLEYSEYGKVTAGLGQGASDGMVGFMNPTSSFGRSCECFVRGLRLQFQMSKAMPGAYHLYFPDYNVLWMSHFAVPFYRMDGEFHPEWENIWDYYMEAYELFQDAEVLLSVNGWPQWEEGGNDSYETSLQAYLRECASLYKYWHDETLFYANLGYTKEEIADKVGVPESFEKKHICHFTSEERQMYIKAVYCLHFGWYDGNPIHFKSLSKINSANNFCKYLRDDFMEIAIAEYEEGNYQEVAEILEKVLIDNPANEKARYLLADSLEQLGYQADYGALRNAYLNSCYELRNPSSSGKLAAECENREMMSLLSPEMFLEKLSIAYHASQEASSLYFSFDIKFALEQTLYYRVIVTNGCIMYQKEEKAPVILVLELNRKQMYQILSNLGKGNVLRDVLPITENKELNRNIWNLFMHIVDLSEYRGYSVMEENIRGVVISCKNMLVPYYEQVRKAKKTEKMTLHDADLMQWQEEYYRKIVKGTYPEFTNIKGITEEGSFYKYDYYLFLYQCFRYLARYCKDTEENRNVIQCIRILEPYLERFAGETADSDRTVFFNVFDFHQATQEVKKIESIGIVLREDGKITACELVEFLLRGYWFLFEN